MRLEKELGWRRLLASGPKWSRQHSAGRQRTRHSASLFRHHEQNREYELGKSCLRTSSKTQVETS